MKMTEKKRKEQTLNGLCLFVCSEKILTKKI